MTTSLGSWQDIALGIVLIVLGLSFAYKCFQASVLGKVTYWTGFLPFTIISPFLIHLPASKRSLIRETQALWVYVVMGPLFFVASMLLIEAGFDIAGLPGTDTVNLLVNGGNKLRPPAITFDKRHYKYEFPILNRNGEQLMEKINKYNVPLADKDKLIEDRK